MKQYFIVILLAIYLSLLSADVKTNQLEITNRQIDKNNILANQSGDTVLYVGAIAVSVLIVMVVVANVFPLIIGAGIFTWWFLGDCGPLN